MERSDFSKNIHSDLKLERNEEMRNKYWGKADKLNAFIHRIQLQNLNHDLRSVINY